MAKTNVESAPLAVEPRTPGVADPFSSAIEASGVPMLIVDPNRPGYPIVHANRAFAELSGYTVEELAGRSYRLLGGPETDPATTADVDQALERRAAIDVELLNYRKDGSPFWTAVFVSPVRRPGGSVSHGVFQCFDVTRRREAEQALARLRGPEGLEALARATAHGFNNALTVIRANVEPLQHAAADPRTVTRLERISEAADRAAALVRTMSAFLRGLRQGSAATQRTDEALPRARAGETVLLVEPDADLCLQAASMLRGLGYQVEAVAAADAALDVIAGGPPPDLLLSEMAAQCDDGTRLVDRARAITPGLRVLHSTTSATSPHDGAVGKPFNLIALARAVREAIDRQAN
jgi:PAS domain S-box-containing protein